MYAKSRSVRVYTKIPVAISLGLFGYCGFFYNAVFVRKILIPEGYATFAAVFSVIFNLFFVLAVWSFFRVHCTDPGRINEQWLTFVTNPSGQPGGYAVTPVPAKPEWQPGKITYNKKAKEGRPERAHFCAVCEANILRMDHFCPWTGNCIGFRNHKFFLQLGFYGFLSAATGLTTSLRWFLAEVDSGGVLEGGAPPLSDGDQTRFGVFETLLLLASVLLLLLMCSHVPLALQNRTSIEESYEKANPYDQAGPRKSPGVSSRFGEEADASSLRNVEEIMGARGLDWLLPIEPWAPRSDGFTYNRAGERLKTLTLPDGATLEEAVANGSVFRDEDARLDLYRFRYQIGLREEGMPTPDTPTSSLLRFLPFNGSWFGGGES